MSIRFGPFTFDAAARQLRRDGEDIHLSRKAFDVLALLVSRRPEVITKEQLLREIWPETFVSEANLNVLVGEVRRALGESAQSPVFVRTAHGVGYAFSGDAVSPPGEASVRARPGAARAWLVTASRTFALPDGAHVIGRDPQCDVWLDDEGVSRRHARIRLSGGEATLEDLQSTNGTFVGRRRVASAVALSDKDVVKVGTVTLEFRAGRNEPAPTKRIRRR